jgi:hypothetical protein
MRRLSKFVNLPGRDQALLVEAALVLGAIRAAWCVFPFRLLRRGLVVRPGPCAGGRASRTVAERVGWAVRLAGRYMPACGGCLVQALAAEVLLSRRGCPARLRIGVARPEGGTLEAHAWVECYGTAVVGSLGDLSRFVPFGVLAEGGTLAG